MLVVASLLRLLGSLVELLLFIVLHTRKFTTLPLIVNHITHKNRLLSADT